MAERLILERENGDRFLIGPLGRDFGEGDLVLGVEEDGHLYVFEAEGPAELLPEGIGSMVLTPLN